MGKARDISGAFLFFSLSHIEWLLYGSLKGIFLTTMGIFKYSFAKAEAQYGDIKSPWEYYSSYGENYVAVQIMCITVAWGLVYQGMASKMGGESVIRFSIYPPPGSFRFLNRRTEEDNVVEDLTFLRPDELGKEIESLELFEKVFVRSKEEWTNKAKPKFSIIDSSSNNTLLMKSKSTLEEQKEIPELGTWQEQWSDIMVLTQAVSTRGPKIFNYTMFSSCLPWLISNTPLTMSIALIFNLILIHDRYMLSFEHENVQRCFQRPKGLFHLQLVVGAVYFIFGGLISDIFGFIDEKIIMTEDSGEEMENISGSSSGMGNIVKILIAFFLYICSTLLFSIRQILRLIIFARYLVFCTEHCIACFLYGCGYLQDLTFNGVKEKKRHQEWKRKCLRGECNAADGYPPKDQNPENNIIKESSKKEISKTSYEKVIYTQQGFNSTRVPKPILEFFEDNIFDFGVTYPDLPFIDYDRVEELYLRKDWKSIALTNPQKKQSFVFHGTSSAVLKDILTRNAKSNGTNSGFRPQECQLGFRCCYYACDLEAASAFSPDGWVLILLINTAKCIYGVTTSTACKGGCGRECPMYILKMEEDALIKMGNSLLVVNPDLIILGAARIKLWNVHPYAPSILPRKRLQDDFESFCKAYKLQLPTWQAVKNSDEVFRIVLWNIQFFSGLRGGQDIDQTFATIKDMDADILLLNEVMLLYPIIPLLSCIISGIMTLTKTDFEDRLRKIGYRYFVYSNTTDWDKALPLPQITKNLLYRPFFGNVICSKKQIDINGDSGETTSSAAGESPNPFFFGSVFKKKKRLETKNIEKKLFGNHMISPYKEQLLGYPGRPWEHRSFIVADVAENIRICLTHLEIWDPYGKTAPKQIESILDTIDNLDRTGQPLLGHSGNLKGEKLGVAKSEKVESTVAAKNKINDGVSLTKRARTGSSSTMAEDTTSATSSNANDSDNSVCKEKDKKKSSNKEITKDSETPITEYSPDTICGGRQLTLLCGDLNSFKRSDFIRNSKTKNLRSIGSPGLSSTQSESETSTLLGPNNSPRDLVSPSKSPDKSPDKKESQNSTKLLDLAQFPEPFHFDVTDKIEKRGFKDIFERLVYKKNEKFKPESRMTAWSGARVDYMFVRERHPTGRGIKRDWKERDAKRELKESTKGSQSEIRKNMKQKTDSSKSKLRPWVYPTTASDHVALILDLPKGKASIGTVDMDALMCDDDFLENSSDSDVEPDRLYRRGGF